MAKKTSQVERRISKNKVDKDGEITSAIGSYILSEMKPGDRIRPTPLAKNLMLRGNKHPHVVTVQSKLNTIGIMEDILPSIRCIYGKDHNVIEIERIDSEKETASDTFIRKEIRKEIAEIKNNIDEIKQDINKIVKSIKK